MLETPQKVLKVEFTKHPIEEQLIRGSNRNDKSSRRVSPVPRAIDMAMRMLVHFTWSILR